MGSDSNIYNMKLKENNDPALKSHNSDSEIPKLSEEKVVFTLGDEIPQTLVRISTNNDDITRICTEIEHFCTSKETKTQDEAINIDIAKYMERKASEECDKSDSDACVAVSDVIVIPSAEAILDTGQKDV